MAASLHPFFREILLDMGQCRLFAFSGGPQFPASLGWAICWFYAGENQSQRFRVNWKISVYYL